MLGVGPLTIIAIASSGLPVSIASLTNPVCTMSGNILTVVAVGQCTIEVTQAGNGEYAAATPVDETFQITAPTQQAQTITFGALSGQTLGAAPFAVSACSSSGLAVSFASLSPSICTVSGNTVSLVAMGQCTIQASQAGNATYSAATPVNQTFQVTASTSKLTQYIVFAALPNQLMGAAPFASRRSRQPSAATQAWLRYFMPEPAPFRQPSQEIAFTRPHPRRIVVS